MFIHLCVCVSGCISFLGMEGGGIGQAQIYASSVHFGLLGLQRWGAELARLNNQGLVNAWTSASHDRNPWIEVRGPPHTWCGGRYYNHYC